MNIKESMKVVFILMCALIASCSSTKSVQTETNSEKNLNAISEKSILEDSKLENCFSATILNDFSNLTKEQIAKCNQHKIIVNQIIEHFYKSPKNEIKCNLKAPYIFNGCQSESCYKYNPKIIAKTELLSSIINGKKIRALNPNESVEVLELKILVKQIGKAVLLDELFEPSFAEESTLNILSYGSEGSEIVCNGNELLEITGNYKFLIPYKAENWAYIKTQDGAKGYISFWDLEHD